MQCEPFLQEAKTEHVHRSEMQTSPIRFALRPFHKSWVASSLVSPPRICSLAFLPGSGQEQHHRLDAQTRDVPAPANLPIPLPGLGSGPRVSSLEVSIVSPGLSSLASLAPTLTLRHVPTSVPESFLRRTSMWHR